MRRQLVPLLAASAVAAWAAACSPSGGTSDTGTGGSGSGGASGTSTGGQTGSGSGGQTATGSGGAATTGSGGAGAGTGGAATGSGGNAVARPVQAAPRPAPGARPVRAAARGRGEPSTGSGGATGTGGNATPPGLGACTVPPAAKFADVQATYDKLKTDLLTSDGAGGFMRIKRPNSGNPPYNSSNSEGIAYGMLIAVYMDDQTVFDNLWKYEQLHLGQNGLMDWEINPEGTAPTGTGAATDGDEDMAFALVMADKKWGGKGTLSDTYLNVAKKQIDLIWQFEVDHTRNDVLMPGDSFGGGQVINISYFAPAYYRVFGQVTGKTAEWNRVVESSYQALSASLNATNKNTTNGLVPAWSTPDGVPMAPSGTSHPTNHQLDSCRTPFRFGQDACWFNEPRAFAYLDKISAFYSTVGAANIVDAYELNGTPAAGASLHLAAFVGRRRRRRDVVARATPSCATTRTRWWRPRRGSSAAASTTTNRGQCCRC